MKLKLVVASMSLLGLISCPVFAASTTQHKYQAHEESYKGEVVNYKGEAFPRPCPKVDMYQPILDLMNQNIYRAKPTVDCDKPIQFAGGVNFDYQMVGPLNVGYMGENNNRFSVNDAYLNATGHVNSWVHAFLEVSYTNINALPLNGIFTDSGPSAFEKPKPGIYSEAYDLDTLTLQQGYIMVGDLERFPLFAKLGKQFVNYGQYVIHPITRSMTQVMTETLQTAAQGSFISSWSGFDFHGSLFAFEDTMGKVDSDEPTEFSDNGHQHTNYGAQLGFGHINDQFGWDVGIGWMYNMMGANDVGYAVNMFRNGEIGDDGTYEKRVNGLTVYGLLNTGPFSLSGHYTTALQHFDPIDLGFSDDDDDDDTDGAKPWAFDVTGAYNFNFWNAAQNLYVGYQQSGDAVNLLIPESRWIAGYSVDVWKNTNLAFEYSHDDDYGTSDGGTGEDSNRVAVRLGVKFG
jgi:hypothetical protein